MSRSLEETRLNTQEQQEWHVCPTCGTANTLDTLSKREYRCGQCNLELAHLDVAANGVIRGIFGWLHAEGDVIEDRYRVKSVLGKGGFGATYLVDDIRLNGKHRALKEVPELLFDEYETTLLSQLNHPSIPDIIDRCIADGMVYLVLEFGGSKTLGGERKQHQGRIPQDKLLPWMRQLCEVLIYLHSQDPPIIHRDLKPDNILLDESGRVMLIDFGIAKESKPATMTRTIGRAATHGFSPPEQAMGTGTDERSDIYALAATFYALLTGKSPPAAHERVAGKEVVPPSQIVTDMSPQLEAAILQALSLNVNHRQQTVKEFSQTLDAIALNPNAPATHAIENVERTVMVSRTIGATDTTGLHPASIKLPSGRINIAKSTPLPTAATPQQSSKRNIIILIAGIAVFAAILTTGYLFWPKTVTEEKPPVATLTPPDKTGTVEPVTGSTTPTVETTTEVKKPETVPTVGSTTGTTKPQVATTGNATPTVGTGNDAKKPSDGTTSALQELTKRQSNQGVQVTPPTESNTRNDQLADEARRRAREEARKRTENERKRQQALATNTRRTEQPVRQQRSAPPEKSWADELKGSVTIVK